MDDARDCCTERESADAGQPAILEGVRDVVRQAIVDVIGLLPIECRCIAITIQESTHFWNVQFLNDIPYDDHWRHARAEIRLDIARSLFNGEGLAEY